MYSLLHPMHLTRYRTFLALQFMLPFILNGISPFLNLILLVLVIRGHVSNFLSLHFVTVLSFINVASMLRTLSVYVNLDLVTTFLRIGGYLKLFINLSLFIASCIFGLAFSTRNVFLLFEKNSGFLGLQVETKARLLVSLDLGSSSLHNSVKGITFVLAMQFCFSVSW